MTTTTLSAFADNHPAVGMILNSAAGPVDAAIAVNQFAEERSLPFSTTEASVRRWRTATGYVKPVVEDTAAVTSEPQFTTTDREALHGRLDELLDRAQADPSSVSGFKIAAWDTTVKNTVTGAAETKRNYGLRLGVEEKLVPDWPVIQPATPSVIAAPAHWPVLRNVKTPDATGYTTTLVLPDIQAGFYRDPQTSRLVPLHNEKAIDVAMQIALDINPDVVLIGGDGTDFAEFGRYRLSPTFAQTTQATLDWVDQFLNTLRTSLPKTLFYWLAGNHEERLPNYILDNARAAFGLRTGGAPDSWPVLSMPHLCNFDRYGVNYIPGYPASEYWFNDSLKAVHGDKVNSSGSTVHKYLAVEDVSTISFHIHRVEMGHRTSHTRKGPKTIMAASPGCLCSLVGAVPSYKGGIDLTGVPVARSEDWQNGLAVVRHNDSKFTYESVTILDDWAMYHGREYRGRDVQ